ncbi:MAG: tRNA uridine-5-carboxymethylaminomethyl(34) synthesis enzyme MnmG, partial [Bradymonadaceae bacterium]
NADWRLSEYGRRLGLLSDEHSQKFSTKKKTIEELREAFQKIQIGASAANISFCKEAGVSSLGNGSTLEELLRRPEIDLDLLRPILARFAPSIDLDRLTPEVSEALEIQIKYEGYIQRQLEQVERHRTMESQVIPSELDYEEIHGLSIEIRERLTSVQPRSVGQASRITGITPAAISALLIHLRSDGTLEAER